MAGFLWKVGERVILAALFSGTVPGVCPKAMPKCEISGKYQAGSQSLRDQTENDSFPFDLGQWNLIISSAFKDVFLAYFYSTSK